MQQHKLGVLSGVNGHYVAVDDRHGAACRRDDKVAVYFEYRSFSYQSLRQMLARKFTRRL